MKNFETAAIRGDKIGEGEDLLFSINGQELVATAPTGGQLALFAARQQDGGIDSFQGVRKFFKTVLDEDGYQVIEDLIDDGAGLEIMSDIAVWLIGEWSGRPTTPSSGSTRSRKSTGTSSTAKPRSKAKT